jgi:hypothetical protein
VNTLHWRIVGPWYRWDLRDAPNPERAKLATRPGLHKFGNEDFIEDFQRNPQLAQTFTEEDFYYRIEALQPKEPLKTGPNAGKIRLIPTRQRCKTDTRKLFQAAHSRYYLVAFQVHCDVPGFPVVAPDKIADAGFVIRRKITPIADHQAKEGNAHLSRLATARATARAAQQAVVSRQQQRDKALISGAWDKTSRLLPVGSRARTRVAQPTAALAAARQEVDLARRRLVLWSQQAGLVTTVQGWVKSPNGSIGTWQEMPEEPEVIVETVYPMFRLVVDPTDPDHAGHFGTILYGYVPTCSAELQTDGSPRLGDTDVYEIRCFVRPLDNDRCPAKPIWSEPTEAYRLASFYDPVGLAQRPINVQMPDFRELEATTALPSVRVATPPGSQLIFKTDKVPPEKDGSTVGGVSEQVCFFAVPLITIVAMFLLNLFLPIIMLLFGLWFMLKLKFCIPPSAVVSGEVTNELAVIGVGIQAAAQLDVDIDENTRINQAKLREALIKGFNTIDSSGKLATELNAKFSNDAMITLLAGQQYGTENNGIPEHPTSVPLDDLVTPEQVVHP